MQFGNKKIDLSVPQVMGILNVTPDSFSDGGRYITMDAALSRAEQMVADGATFIDIGGESTRPGALQVAVESGVPVCLMHMLGEPDTMQQDPHYDDVVTEVRDFLAAQVAACAAAGIAPKNIILDPGFGFAKNLEHNLKLFQHLEHICALGFPVLVGVSRKRMLGEVTGRDVADRAVASAAAAAMAVMKGAVIIRAHDVRENVDAVKMAAAILGV